MTGNFDKQAMIRFLDQVISAGVHGVLALGTYGEFYALRGETRQETAEFLVDYVNGRVPVIFGIGGTCIDDVLYFGQHATRCGANAVLVIKPYYSPL
ncbi:MAG: dihydrodipicolinate synthase family protein [Candidatus Malihini olakiniferum]